MKTTVKITKLNAADLTYSKQSAPKFQAAVYIGDNFFFAGALADSESAAKKDAQAIKRMFKHEIKTEGARLKRA